MSSVESSSVKPTDVEREVRESLIKSDSNNKVIPTWNSLSEHYESRWNKDKEKFQQELRANFFSLVERFASGKQEVFMLSISGQQREKLYIRAFLELFESGYAPHVGDAERVAGRKIKRLFVTLPHNYHD